MTLNNKSNFERFLKCASPRVSVHYYIQTIGSSSSSSVASGARAEEVRKPRIGLSDIWSAYEEWSSFGLEVPLSLDDINSKVTQHYVPSLSAIQIFTSEPFADESSSRSTPIGLVSTETKSAKPDSYSNYKHRFLHPDSLGYLYFQYNETISPFERNSLTHKVTELAEQHKGLSSLMSSDLSPYSWISVAWYPIYPIPSVKSRKELSASFLTYHSLTPCFPETIGNDDEQGVSKTTEVELPPFAAVTYKAFGNLWNMPGTLDSQKRDMREEAASSWVETLDFTHSDFNFFMSRKFYGVP